MVMRIELTQGKEALVDDEDYERLAGRKWWAMHTHGHWYASSNYGRGPSGGNRMMHRVILDAPKELFVDHINGDGLDNRRCNLRLATRSENQRNRRMTKGKRFKGIRRNGERWVSHITLGTFDTEEAAARAYDQAAKLLFGDFARLNFHGDNEAATVADRDARGGVR
jgi:hypothetical protein